MKFKMSENSLFALLLRSPWWISFVLVACVALISKALLPSEYFIYGALGGFPIFVVGCIAAWATAAGCGPRGSRKRVCPIPLATPKPRDRRRP